ncbi:cytochrome c [Myxococcota bacterium]|nr:cytochrome c [Myxococcota bacterium]
MRNLSFVLAMLLVVAVAACKKDPAPNPSPNPTQKATADKALAGKKAEPKKAADTSLPGDPLAGEKIFKEKGCMACHGADGRGNGGVTAADFVKEPERLAKDNKDLLHSITNGITKGSRVMPAHKGTLSEKQIKDALSYVRKQFGSKK